MTLPRLSNQNPYFYRFRCHHPLITQLTHCRTLLVGLWLHIYCADLCLFLASACLKKDQSGHQIECLYVNGLPAHSAVEEFSRIVYDSLTWFDICLVFFHQKWAFILFLFLLSWFFFCLLPFCFFFGSIFILLWYHFDHNMTMYFSRFRIFFRLLVSRWRELIQ